MQQKPFLIYITDTEGYGGAEVYLQRLLQRVDKQRYRVGLIIPERPGSQPLVDAARAQGVEVFFLEHVHQPGLDPRIIWRAWRLFRQLRPTIIHFMLRSPRQAAEAVVAAWLARIPYRLATFLLVTGVPTFHGLEGWLRKINRMAQYRLFHVGIAVSQGNQALLLEQHGFPAERLHYIPNGIDPTIARAVPRSGELRQSWQIPPAVPLIGLIARMNGSKGHDILLQALPQVWAHHPQVHVVLVGTGEHEAQIKAQAQAIDEQQRIHFVGYQKDLPNVLAELDIFVLPSFHEGLSLALLEAMASEKVIVATATDGSTEVLTHGENGLLVPIGDSAALAKALLEVLEHPEQHGRLGRVARETIIQQYHFDRTLARIWALYESKKATRASQASP